MSPDLSPIRPTNDPRISLRSAILNSHTYGYLYAPRQRGTIDNGTILLIHGFPDISYGWRNQIPLFTSLGLDVLAPDCLGYGRSDAPASSHLSAYTYKTIADDMAELCAQLGLSSIVLGGHDWGGVIVYRIALYYPKLIEAVFSICTPFHPPSLGHVPLPLVVRDLLPNFRYQVQFGSGEVEDRVKSEEEIRRFLWGMYGGSAVAVNADGKTKTRLAGFDPEKGVLFDNLDKLKPSRLLTNDQMDYYVREYARHGMNGPLNWYRCREANYVDELDHFFDGGSKKTENHKEVRILNKEVLFVQAMKDEALTDAMTKKMEQRIEKLRWKRIDGGHWILWQKADEVNAILKEWLDERVFRLRAGKSKL